ncbi:MAG: type II toxin-antitoxin system prevent-host-death family antitoxin [Zoogloeaceae bacterium]|jgi:antitoxin StbD|nr:type II toxin-antitoxin system prevent-host-death family antitoxin [Zoogloeaceae bacterium]
METLYANHSVSMSEFKRNPAQVLREADGQAVAVLNHNHPAFYMVPSALFETLLERHEDRALAALARERLRQADKAIEVDIDQL